MKNRDQITMMLLQEALPGLVDKYWKHGGSSNGRKFKSIVDDYSCDKFCRSTP